MSTDRAALSQVPGPAPTPPGPDHEQGPRSRSSWPVTRLPAVAATLLLGLLLATPTIVDHLHSTVWPALLLPVILATLAARLVFEAIDGSAAGRRLHAPAAASGAAIGTVVMIGATLILGLRSAVAVELATFGLACVALAGAGLLRDLEIRVGQALRRVYFVGAGASLAELRRELDQNAEGRLVGAIGPNPPLTPEQIADGVRRSRATVLVLDRHAAHEPAAVAAATALATEGVRVRELLSYYESSFKKVPLTELTPAWFLFERSDHRRRAITDAVRRITMILLAAVLLFLSLPVLLLLLLAVRLTSPGPAIFRQTRVGKDGIQFTLVKLRTMTVARGSVTATAGAWATDEDHRITTLGRVLRRYRLDELPQLWNVIRGELALIGPRPEQVPIVERLEREIPFYASRHAVRPGLTGWAQVNLGYSGSLEGTRAKLQRDLYYVKHRGLRLDLLILWLTLKVILSDPR